MATTTQTQIVKPDEGHPLILRTFGDARFHSDGDLLALAYKPDGSLCSIEEPGVLRRWDAEGRQLGRHFLSDLETLWAFSPQAKWVVAACDELIIWDVETHKVLARLEQPSWITAVAFSPDLTTIATGHDDGVVRLWNPANEQLLAELSEHDLPVSALAFDADGARLASAGEDRKIKIWDVAKRQLVQSLIGHTDRIPGVAWHPAGKILVSVGWDATARVWDVATGEPNILLNTHDDQVQVLTFSPDGSLLATSDSASTVHVWGDVLAAQALHRLPGYSDEVRALAFRADGQRLAVGGTDRVIHVYDSHSGKIVAGGGRDSRRAVAYCNLSQPLIAVNSESGVRIWDADSGAERPSPLPPGEYRHLAASPNGRWLAGVTPDSLIHLWDNQTQTHKTMDGPKSAPNYLVFGPDSKTLTAAVANEGTVWLWDLDKLEASLLVIEATEGSSVEAIARHPDGRLLLCGGIDFLSTSGTTGAVCVWDLNTKQRLQSLPHGATCVAFDTSGARFAFATPEGVVMVASTDSAEILMELDGPEDDEMTALFFSPDGAWLLGAAEDGTLRAWDLSNGELLALRQVATPVHSFAVSPSGRLFTGNENTTCYELALPQMTELP